MEPQDALPTIAEISVTVVGFTGVLVAFRPASAGSWSREELIRIRAALTNPGIVLVCSLLPFGLSGFSQSPQVVWGIPLVLWGVTTFLITVQTLIEIFRGDFRLTSRPLGAIMIAGGLLVQVLAIASGLGLVLQYSAGLFVLALSWNLVTTAATLILILVFWSRPPAA